MKVGIKDIAAKANVSLSAVSLALNNKQGVSKSTREKVLAVAKELEYSNLDRSFKSDAAFKARFLKISRHGHILNSSHESFVGDYISGIMESAYLHNMKVEIDSFDPEDNIDSIIDIILQDKDVDGYIVLATELLESDMLKLLQTNRDIVFVDSYFICQPADCVTMNNMEAVYKVLSYFKELGHKKIGFIGASLFTPNFNIREEAFYSGLKKYGLEFNEEFVFKVDSTFEGAYRDMTIYLESGMVMPEAAFACSDIIALGCIKALKEYGIEIPDEMSIVGFDNLPVSEMSSPQLSSINVSKRQIGRVALDLLYLKVQHSNQRLPLVSMISVDLIERESSKKNIRCR